MLLKFYYNNLTKLNFSSGLTFSLLQRDIHKSEAHVADKRSSGFVRQVVIQQCAVKS